MKLFSALPFPALGYPFASHRGGSDFIVVAAAPFQIEVDGRPTLPNPQPRLHLPGKAEKRGGDSLAPT